MPVHHVCISLTCLHVFRIYCSGTHGPVLLLLHGGGHSALSWAVFTVKLATLAEALYILHSVTFDMSGVTLMVWGLYLQAVICSRINCRVVAMDLRAHGKCFT